MGDTTVGASADAEVSPQSLQQLNHKWVWHLGRTMVVDTQVCVQKQRA